MDIEETNDSKDGDIVCSLKNVKAPIEWQADYFAACLIMPEKEIREAFQKVCGPEPFIINNIRNGVKKNLEAKNRLLNSGLSLRPPCVKQAMIIRLQDLGLLINQTTTRMDWKVLRASM